MGARYVKRHTDIAEALGVSQQQVYHWSRNGMPPAGKRGYDLKAISEWLESKREAKKERSGNEKDLRIAKIRAETKKLNQEARFKRLKNLIMEGRLIEVSDVRQWIAEKFLRIKMRLESVPSELQMIAPSQIRPQFRTDMERWMQELLLEMASWEYSPEVKDAENEATG